MYEATYMYTKYPEQSHIGYVEANTNELVTHNYPIWDIC